MPTDAATATAAAAAAEEEVEEEEEEEEEEVNITEKGEVVALGNRPPPLRPLPARVPAAAADSREVAWCCPSARLSWRR